MSEKIKFAVIGQGHIGKRHADMVRRNPEAELIAVCDIAPKGQLGLNDLKELFYNSVEDLLEAHPEIEVVNVCTPNGLHAQHSLIALEAGKNVVCEKPMALTKADCEAMLFKALQVNKTVFCVMQNRYSPPSVWLKKIVDEKIIGDVFMVQLNCYWNRDERY
jgi:predicted dehydrogenase